MLSLQASLAAFSVRIMKQTVMMTSYPGVVYAMEMLCYDAMVAMMTCIVGGATGT